MPANSAASPPAGRNPLAHSFAACAPSMPANDDAPGDCEDRLLRAALVHFVQHGLGAAEAAFVEAEGAYASGDRAGAAMWTDICRTFDRRLAARLSGDATPVSR